MITIDGKDYYGVIYKIENIITHKVYIGQTTHKRGFNGRYYYNGVGIERVYNFYVAKRSQGRDYNRYLLGSIEKCGFDAFIIDEVLDTALTKDELNEKEAYYIDKYNSYKDGYNMTLGGDSAGGFHKPSGKDCPNSKRVCQLSLDGELIKIWDSATDACNELHICQSSISNVCSGKMKTAGGYVWVHEKDYNPELNYKRIPQIKDNGRGTKPVFLLSENNEIVKEFYSVHSAAKFLGIKPQDASRICKHQRSKYNYRLIFKCEYMEEQRLSVRDCYDNVA